MKNIETQKREYRTKIFQNLILFASLIPKNVLFFVNGICRSLKPQD